MSASRRQAVVVMAALVALHVEAGKWGFLR